MSQRAQRIGVRRLPAGRRINPAKNPAEQELIAEREFRKGRIFILLRARDSFLGANCGDEANQISREIGDHSKRIEEIDKILRGSPEGTNDGK
jgi:hypothetical protein